MKIKVLDHGYVELIETWGHGKAGAGAFHSEATTRYDDCEAGIIEAARQSTQGSFRGWGEGDAKLLRYLFTHQHSTPFEFAGMTLEVKLPIMAAREWIRHRTESFNEASARYAPLEPDYYVPTVERVMLIGAKQGGAVSAQPITLAEAEWFVAALAQEYDRCEALYQAALARGVPKELARLIMPVGHYTQWRVSANLRNWLAFLALRLDPAAQKEIRDYASAVLQIVRYHFPHTAALFEESRNEGIQDSRQPEAAPRPPDGGQGQ